MVTRVASSTQMLRVQDWIKVCRGDCAPASAAHSTADWRKSICFNPPCVYLWLIELGRPLGRDTIWRWRKRPGYWAGDRYETMRQRHYAQVARLRIETAIIEFDADP